MKIGVNARLLIQPFTGIGQYTKNLFAELAKIDPKSSYILVVPRAIPGSVRRLFPKNVKIKILPEKNFPTAGMRKVWWEQISLPAFFDQSKVDVAFFTYPSNPWSGDWYKKKIRTIVTVHDCIPWVNKHYRRGVLSRMYHAQTKKAVKLANEVLTVSESSARDIEKVCGVAANKITVAYNDAAQSYKVPPGNKLIDKVLKRFGLKKNEYFLYVGGYDKRKNVEFLLAEYKKLGNLIPLVLAGGQLYGNNLYASFDTGDLGGVIRTGFLAEEDLAALYRGALAFINLSSQEGFNITILEAANCKTPMILSDIEVHREVAGDQAIFIDIQQEGAAVEAMKKMMDSKVRESFAQKSADLAKKYSIKKYAQIVKNVLFS